MKQELWDMCKDGNYEFLMMTNFEIAQKKAREKIGRRLAEYIRRRKIERDR